MKKELLDLTRQLRHRIELAGGDDILVSSQTKNPSKNPRQPNPLPNKEGKESVAAQLKALKEEVSACRKCPLGKSRLNAVFGVGSETSPVVFVGEGPGFQEDHKGEPFVGRSGQLLDKILAAIGYSRQTVYIANIVKCHPMRDPSNPEAHGNDRPPSPEEVASCLPYLEQQIKLIAPKVIVTLGAVATRVLLQNTEPITKIRGQWQFFYPSFGDPVKLLPTFHPAALLRNPNLKKDAWEDMKKLRKELQGS